MRRRLFAVSSIALPILFPWLVQHRLWAANIRDHIEAVRRKAPVAYVGVVREVNELSRSKLAIRARATIRVLNVPRAPAGRNPAEAALEYSSYDDRTPPLEGGPQYRLERGTMVLVFTDSFNSAAPPGYVLQGAEADLLRQVDVLRQRTAQLSDAQLKFNEITEADRQVQVELYDKVSAFLRSTK